LQIFAYKQIFACKYLYTTEYCLKLKRKAFHKSRASINIRFFLKMFASLSFKIFALKQKKNICLEKNICFNFACKIRIFALMQNKQIKPVLFASMGINIRFKPKIRGAL
jgi:hypothetical protein